MSDHSHLFLKGAHVVDPRQGIDRVADVILKDGKIAAIGDLGSAGDRSEVIDLSGHYLSPGWIDIHVHTYGTLGFADPDSIGIYQGVTTYLDAGGSGIDVMDEFMATMEGLTTELYAGAHIRSIGMVGLDHIEDELRSIDSIPLLRWTMFMKRNPGLIRFVKMGAFHEFERPALRFGKGMAEMLGLPLYIHIGEFGSINAAPETNLQAACEVLGKGDFITHIYHGNPGGILDKQGRVHPYVQEAQERGVIFDIGLGGNNFSWEVAERAYAQNLMPHVISSDLQQYNVMGPTFSLAHVLSIFHRLGMSVQEVIRRVTDYAASSIGLNHLGSIPVGSTADITIFKLEGGSFELADSKAVRRAANRRFAPVMAFKRGVRYDTDLSRAQQESNWLLIPSEDMPASAHRLSAMQYQFLGELAEQLDAVDWDFSQHERIDLSKPGHIKAAFERARSKFDLSLRDAMYAVYYSFTDNPFSVQIGLFIFRQERQYALSRLRSVAALGATSSSLETA